MVPSGKDGTEGGFLVGEVLEKVVGQLFERLDQAVPGGPLVQGAEPPGGILDRVDAILFAAPAAYFCILAFGVH